MSVGVDVVPCDCEGMLVDFLNELQQFIAEGSAPWSRSKEAGVVQVNSPSRGREKDGEVRFRLSCS